MALPADKDGFLVGAPTPIDTAEWARAMAVWSSMASDVSAIRQLLSKPGRAPAPISRVNNVIPIRRDSAPVAVRSLPPRDAQGRFIRAVTPVQSSTQAPAVAGAIGWGKVADQIAAPARKAVTPDRDLSGRFSGGGKGAGSARDGEGGAIKSAISDGFTTLRDAIPTVGDVEEVDPTIRAAREVADLASTAVKPVMAISKTVFKPLAGLGRFAFGRLFGREQDKAIPWYKRIVKELKGIREQREGGGDGSGILGSLLGGASNLFGGLGKGLLGALGGLVPPVMLPGGRRAPRRPGDGRLGKAARFGRSGLLRRLPLIGSALAGLAAADAVFADDDPNLSPADNRKARHVGVGGAAGSLAGGLAGMKAGAALGAFLGPFGMAAGGVVGGIIGTLAGDEVGQMLGEWTASVDWPGVADAIKGTFESVGIYIQQGWDTVVGWYDSAVDATSRGMEAVADTYRAAVDKTSAAMAWADEKTKPVRQRAGAAYDATVNATSRGMEAVAGVGRYVGESLGILSAKYEGKAGSVAMDNNGAYAYGKYQFNSKAGGLKAFFEANPQYREQFAGLAVGSKAFNDRWQELARTDPAFEKAQDAAARVKFFDPLQGDAEKAGFRLDDRGVQEALFSAAINHSPSGNRAIYRAASATPGFATMTGTDQLRALYRARGEYVQSANIAGGQPVKDALAARYAREQADAIALSSAPAMTVMPRPNVAQRLASAANIEQFVPQPAPAQMRKVAAPSSSREKSVISIKQPAGQNVGDRAIAQLATGGMGSYMGGS